MGYARKLLILSILFVLVMARQASGAEVARTVVGIRGGMVLDDRKRSFREYEAFVLQDLPWRWHPTRSTDLRLRVEGTAGTLTSAGDVAFIATVGPNLALGFFDAVWLEIGGRAAVMNRHRFGSEDLGGDFLFVTHAGLGVRLGANLSAAYRFQHMSNSSIYDCNPGLNMHLLELGYSF